MTPTASKIEYQKILARRNKDLDSTRYSYKLADAGQYGFDIVISDQNYGIDESRMSAWIPFADGQRRDGVGDLIEVGGIDTSRHSCNPIILFDHGKGQHKYANWPIALAEDRESKAYTVEIDPISKVAKVNAFFYQGGPNGDKDFSLYCEQIYDLWCKKFIRAGSIGYQVIAARELRPDYEKGTPQGLHLMQTLMLEASCVVLPANADTVTKTLEKSYRSCGKPLSPYLVKSLSSYAPTRKAQMGYESKSIEEKLISLAKEAMEIKLHGGEDSPDYGQMFWNNTTKEVWYVTADGDGNPFVSEFQEKLEKLVGKEKTTIEAESFPPRSDDNWIQLYPSKNGKGLKSLRAKYKTQMGYEGKGLKEDISKELRSRGKGNKVFVAAIVEDYGQGSKEVLKQLQRDNQVRLVPAGSGMAKFAGEWFGSEEPTKEQINQFQNLCIQGGGSYFVYAEWDGDTKSLRAKYKAGSIPKPENVMDFVVGDKVVARSYLSYINAAGKTDNFAKTGDKLTIVGTNGPMWVCRRSDGKEASFGSVNIRKGKGLQSDQKALPDSKIPPAKWKPGIGAIKDLRTKYRTAKGLRRRMRKSVAGSSVMHVSSKDVQRVREVAESKGLKFKRMGEDNGVEKIKLTGSDEAIDTIAKEFGKPLPMKIKGAKSIGIAAKFNTGDTVRFVDGGQSGIVENRSKDSRGWVYNIAVRGGGWVTLREEELRDKGKSMPKVMKRQVKAAPMDDALDVAVDDADVELDGMDTEEQPTQKYSAQILQRMHEDASILLEEYEEMRGPLENESVDAHLQKKLENLVSELDEIEGLYAKHHPEEEPLGGQKDLEGEEETEGEDADLEMDDAAVEADSEEEEEPTPDEALEGMETKMLRDRYIKSLRKSYGRKCAECGKEGCSCSKKDLDAEGQMDDLEEVQEQPENKALEPHEKEKVGEAAEYLKELGTTQDFNDEHRMKSYHFHKSLEPMAGNEMEMKSADAEGQMDKVDDLEEVQEQKGMDNSSRIERNAMMAAGSEWDKRDRSGSLYDQIMSIVNDDNDLGSSEIQRLRNLADQARSLGKAMDIPDPMEMVGQQNHQKSIGDASRFLKELSTERAFGDQHREKCMMHAKALDPIANADDTANVQEGDETEPVMGEMGQKKLKAKAKQVSKIKAVSLEQNKTLVDLSNKVAKLLKVVG